MASNGFLGLRATLMEADGAQQATKTKFEQIKPIINFILMSGRINYIVVYMLVAVLLTQFK